MGGITEISEMMRNLRDRIEHFRDGLQKLEVPTRVDIVQRIYKRQIRELFQDVEKFTDTGDMWIHGVPERQDIDHLLDKLTEKNKREVLKHILAHFSMISEADRGVLFSTFADLPLEDLKKEIFSLKETLGAS